MSTRQKLLDQYWLEFIEWAVEEREYLAFRSWDVARHWSITWQAPIWSDSQASTAGRLGDPSLLRSYSRELCTLKTNEENFWRWYMLTKHEGKKKS